MFLENKKKIIKKKKIKTRNKKVKKSYQLNNSLIYKCLNKPGRF